MAKKEGWADEDLISLNLSAADSQKDLKNALYAHCASLATEKVFNQQDLISLKIIPNDDVNQLLSCTRQLTKDGLFKLMIKDGRPCWKVVKKEDAAKYVHRNTSRLDLTTNIPLVILT